MNQTKVWFVKWEHFPSFTTTCSCVGHRIYLSIYLFQSHPNWSILFLWSARGASLSPTEDPLRHYGTKHKIAL
jgi:hypothetical protein